MLKTKYRNLSEIKCLEGNPRTINEDSFKKLCTSIENNPQYFEARPIILSDRTGELVSIAGNQRVKAAKHLKLKEVPTILIPNLTEAKEREIIIRDNVSNGDWDMDILESDWDMEELGDWDLNLNFEEEEELQAVEDDYEQPEQMQVDVVQGDLIEFVCIDGRVHRLLCGDSTDSDAVGKLMDGRKADMVFTDPPYGMEFKSNFRQKTPQFSKIINDDKILDIAPVLDLFMNKDSVAYICTRWDLYNIWFAQVGLCFDIKNCVVWYKKGGGLGDLVNSYSPNHEFIIVAHKGKRSLQGKRHSDVWEISRDSFNNYNHPTQKPVELSSFAINNHSKTSDLILDLFLGSGSTMAAAHQLNRTCYGMELDEKYCQVIIDRMTKLDETLTVNINGKEYKKEGAGVPF